MNADDFVTIIVAIIGSGVLNTLITYGITSHEKSKERYQGERQANRLIMKDRLRHLCSNYISQGWIYEDELEDLMAMHSCYHTELGGNGFLDEMMARVKHLEIRGVGVK